MIVEKHLLILSLINFFFIHLLSVLLNAVEFLEVLMIHMLEYVGNKYYAQVFLDECFYKL